MIRARFIGVGKFADPLISELTGCARDATPLCTLFEDTIDGVDARSFVDARRHGLLTAALIDALTSADHPGVLSLVEHVIDRVRTDASSMGVTQRPESRVAGM